MNIRILCIGDLHLGRRSSRLPDGLDGYGISPSDLTPAATWRSAVNWAVEHKPDLAVLTGDVIEAEEDRFEAYGHLKWGIATLLESGIPVFAVAGNHDWDALPRLAGQLPAFRLVGRGGNWETVTHELADGSRLGIVGWSFPERYCRENPLRQISFSREPGLPTLGLLHCDLDAAGSLFAPVPRRDLETVPVDAWLLGHIHKPSPLSGPRPIGYLGSLAGLDPGEPGAHGPWLATVNGPGDISIGQIPLARLRWENEEIGIGLLEGEDPQDLKDSFFRLIREAIGRIHARVAAGSLLPRVVGCRFHLTGRSPLHHQLRSVYPDFVSYQEPSGGVHYFIEKFIDEAGPGLNLTDLARGNDPPSLLARFLVDLTEKKGRDGDLILAYRDAVSRTVADPRWSRLGKKDLPDEEKIRQLLLEAGYRALEELLAQPERARGGGR